MRRFLAVGVCAVALGLGGCGGGSDAETGPASTTSSTMKDTATAPQPSHQSAAGQEEGKGKGADGSAFKGEGKATSSPKQSGSAVTVPPISAAPVAGSEVPAPGVKTVKGADDSVQTYGVESDEATRTEAAIALQAYLGARLQEDWAAACAALAQRPKAELEKLAQKASAQGKGLAGCAGAMAALGEGTSRSQLREEATITEVLSFRGEGDVSGDPSYLLFTAPPGLTLYSMPMYFEAGGWKVGLALPAELPV